MNLPECRGNVAVSCGFAPGHSDRASSSVNGNASASKSHASHANGYICKDCSSHSHKSDSIISQSSSASLLSSQAAEASSGILSTSTSSSPFTSIYSRDRSRRTKTGEWTGWASNRCSRLSFLLRSKLQGAEVFLTSVSRCPVLTVQHVCAVQQTSLGPPCVVRHPPLQQRALAEVEG